MIDYYAAIKNLKIILLKKRLPYTHHLSLNISTLLYAIDWMFVSHPKSCVET